MPKIETTERCETPDRAPLRVRFARAGRVAGCLVPVLWIVVGCGGEEEARQPATSAIDAAQRTAGQVAERTDRIAQQAAQVADIDADLAASGEEAFRSRGCMACHTIGGGRLVGPDLLGVTERRTPVWIRAMILKPDSMIRNDATAKQLYAEYFTPMPYQQVTSEQATAIYEFLRSKNEGG